MRRITVEELAGQLWETVDLLAASAEEQSSWLREKRMPVDELALGLDDAVTTFVPRLLSAGIVDDTSVNRLVELKDIFSEMTNLADASLWTDAALAERGEWRLVRDAARSFLDGWGHTPVGR